MGLLYYSAQTILAHTIAEDYYGGIFYVYVAETFNPNTNPTSSNPKLLYKQLRTIHVEEDEGSDKLLNTKRRIRGIADKKLALGHISSDQRDEISSIIRRANSRQFRPLLYLIREDKVAQIRLNRVKPNARANLQSREFTIADLQPSEFEIVDDL